MLQRAPLETLQTWLRDPAQAAFPLRERIQRALRQLILDGALGAGSPLPASRALARTLGVSRDTVEAAYGQLYAEGFITRQIGRGSAVAELTMWSGRTRRTPPTASRPNPSRDLSRRGREIFMSGGVREPIQPRPFAPGIPETRTFPLSTWERVQRQVLKEFGGRALSHGDPQGSEALRTVIADYLNLERGGRVHADQIVVLTSTQQALSLCAALLLDPGDEILIEDPAYGGARRAFEAAGLKCTPIPVDAQGISVDQLTAHPTAKAVYITPSHQFPTGATLSLERRMALIDWAVKQRVWILEDDYDSEFHYVGRPTACVQGLDRRQRTLYLGTFTKSLFPGIRLGYAVVPPPLVSPLVTARTLQDGHTATITQLTLARFMENGHFGSYVRSMRGVYAQRLEKLTREIDKRLPGILVPHPPLGGLQMSCTLDAPFDEQRVIAHMRGRGVELIDLKRLYAGPTKTRGWLMGFAAYTLLEIETAVTKLAQVLESQRRRR